MSDFDKMWDSGSQQQTSSSGSFDKLWDSPPSVSSEDWLKAAGTEVVQQNVSRRQAGKPDLNTDESEAIMNAYRMMAGKQPDKLRTQIAAETTARSRTERGLLGDISAGAFEGITSPIVSMEGLVAPEAALQAKEGQAAVANIDPNSLASKTGSFVAGLGAFALEGPVAIGTAALGGAGESRMASAEARKRGEEVGGTTEAVEAVSRGIIDGVLTKFMLKAGSNASNVVRSLIQPAVKEALVSQGIDTARKLATTWALDSIKSGAIAETQYLADVGLEHLQNPEVVPTAAEAAKAAAFGFAFPTVAGAAHGIGGLAHTGIKEAFRTPELPGGEPTEVGPAVAGTENYPVPPPVRVPETPLATIPRQPSLITPPGGERVYPGEPGPETPRVITPFPPQGSIHAPEIIDLIKNAPERPVTVDNTHDIPSAAVTAESDPSKVLIDKDIKPVQPIDGKPVEVSKYLALHEQTERSLEEAGVPHDEAHEQATAAEHDTLARDGVDPAAYEAALKPQINAAEAKAGKATTDLPSDIHSTEGIAENRGSIDAKKTPDEIVDYIRSNNEPTADAVTPMLGDGPFVRRDVPLTEIEPNIMGPGDVNPVKLGQVAANRAAGNVANPIVLAEDGSIADGTHRFLDAQGQGAKTISAWVPEKWAKEKGLEKAPPVKPAASLKARLQTILTPPEAKPSIARPKSVVLDEAKIQHQPEGFQNGTPHATYNDASAATAGTEFGPSLTGHNNPWVRPTQELGNAKRQLLIQFSTELINGDRPRTSADDYYDKLYSNRSGYSRPKDFWELPQWIGVASKNLPNADVYVVRDMGEAARFLDQAKYGTIAFSALDVNSKLVQGLIDTYKGKVAIGGYTDMTPFKGRDNVTVYKTMPEWIKAEGKTFQDGVDYRHFRGTEVVPRLSLSEGCLHNCDFCGVEGKGHAPREVDKAVVDEQIKAFRDLKAKLVYINDKTFGQAQNHQDLIEIRKKIQKDNPAFEGFIIQTSAAQMQKMDPKFLQDAGVKYVEMGVESYNDSILKSVKKPANEKLIDSAVAKIRESGAQFIPNVMIGLPGETPETYQHTLSFLDKNADVISHVNAYNVALYQGSELAKKLGGLKTATDADENITQKSWQQTPQVDQAFHDAVMKFGSEALDKTPGAVPQLPAAEEQPGLLGQFLKSEQGAVSPEKLVTAMGGQDVAAAAKAAVDTVTSAAADLQKTFAPATRGESAQVAAGAMRQENSRAARKADVRAEAYQKAAKGFDALIRTRGQQFADDFMDRINRGEKQADPALQPLADHMDAERRAKVKDMQSLGVGAGEKFDENWFGRQWKNADAAKQFFGGRKNLTGPKTFLKGRTLESVAEGRAAGLELITDNPVEMHNIKMGEMDRYIAGVRVLKDLEMNGFTKRILAGESAPDGWVRIHDQVGLYKAKNPMTGAIEKGSFYAPREVADLINNHLSPGLRGKAWFQMYLGSANWMNQLHLGMSGFHLSFTSADAIVSKFALAFQRLANYQDISGAVKDFVSAPAAPITNAIRGHKGLMEWVHPGTQGSEVGQIINVLEDAGARARMDTFYRTHVTDKLMQAWRQGNVLGAVGRALLLPAELPTRFIMEVVVPRQKLGVAMDLVRMEMHNNPNATHAELVAKARKIWDSADNRMGQLVYDNLFWNKMTKDLAMATVRSVGWNLGTFREILGGAVDLAKAPVDLARGKKPQLTTRAAYVMALPLVHAMTGAILNYLFTGEAPKDLKDYFFPRTGGVDEQGRPSRISLPTYMKDVYHFSSDPIKTLAGKVHPMLTSIYEMLTNKDFYGVQIRNEDDPIIDQMKEIAKNRLKNLEPLSVRNLQRGLEQGQTPVQAARSFVGLTPAPTAISQTRAERVASDLVSRRMPSGAKTEEEFETSALKRQLRGSLAKGDPEPLRAAVRDGKISTSDAKKIISASSQNTLQRQMKQLEGPEVLKVWDAATDQEKQDIKAVVIKKLMNYSKDHTAEEFNNLAAKYRQKGILK
jgi:hypothetical protein